jgi:hypothetical protein
LCFQTENGGYEAQRGAIIDLYLENDRFSKKFTYETEGRGSYDITSPAFSKEYEVSDSSGSLVANFEKVNRWLSSGAFTLRNQSADLDSYELVAVIMGMHAIQKRQDASHASH